ncbi:hypothetical protein [Undibacterium pigrum]|uniref:Uncharacterized protein n=1 Tax=Undibacterium pigrum TaxID=401470 RepID=A0A318J5C9_9BURK|nr:hypothetical protein [Undibacterium pigrum]PXX43049.1 hypothetical protein DFR42_10449 [Undibacterium pigrum]
MNIITTIKKQVPILLSLLKEFWLPVTLTFLAWLYSSYQKNPKNTAEIIGIFSMCGFWVAQWNRISRQLKVDKNLNGIEAKAEKLLEKLDEKTLNLVNHITGGDGFCYATPVVLIGEAMTWTFTCVGGHPIHDVSVRLINVENLGGTSHDFHDIGTLFPEFGAVYAKTVGKWESSLPIGNFLVFFNARNGRWIQELKWIVEEGKVISASRIIRGTSDFAAQDPIYFEVDPEYPWEAKNREPWQTPSLAKPWKEPA